MKKVIIILISFIIPFVGFGQIGATEDCNSIPEPGTCLAYIVTYYFNQNTSQCEESYWGGCDGVVPFWTLEECQNNCENNSLMDEVTTKKILLKTIDILGRGVNKKGFYIEIYDDSSVKKKYRIEQL